MPNVCKVWPILPMVSLITGANGPSLWFGGISLPGKAAPTGKIVFRDLRLPPMARTMADDNTLPEDFLLRRMQERCKEPK